MSEQMSQCEQCQQRYTLFRRKKQCNLCGQVFCSKCVLKSPSVISLNNSRTCVTCLLITNHRTTRDQLASIRTKHLRAYLVHSKIVSTNRLESCFEKQDLVNLIESKKRQLPEESYVFVERSNITVGQTTIHNTATTSNNNATTSNNNATTNINNRQEEARPTVTPNRSEQVPTPTNIAAPPVPSSTDQRSETPVDPPPKTAPVRIAINDLLSIESIQNLTVRQLKEILVQNFVSTKGCVEKRELISKVELLYRDHQQQKEINTNVSIENSEGNICKICMDAIIDCVFLDCGHLCTCIQCGKRLSECPLCRSYIIRVVRVFKS